MSEQVYEPIYKLPEFIGDGCFICRRLGIRRVLYRACGQHKLHRTCVLILRGQEAVPVIALTSLGCKHIIDLRGDVLRAVIELLRPVGQLRRAA